jgi:hypothetical protein
MEAHLFVLFQLDHANPFRPYKDGQWLLLLAAAFLKYNNITTTTTTKNTAAPDRVPYVIPEKKK